MPRFTVPTIPQDCDTLVEIDSLSAHPRYGEIFKSAWKQWTSGETAPATESYGVVFARGVPIALLPFGHRCTCLIGAALIGRLYDRKFKDLDQLIESMGIDSAERSGLTNGFDGGGLVNHREAGEFAIRVRDLVIKIWGQLPNALKL